MKVNANCAYSGTLYAKTKKNNLWCSPSCRDEWNNIRKSKFKYKDLIEGRDYVVCQICGFYAAALSGHLSSHGYNTEQYREEFSCETVSAEYRETSRRNITGDKNPAYQHGGRLSPFSDKFKYAGRYDKTELSLRANKTCKDNGNLSTTLKYYTSRGMSEEDAKTALKNRQTTFSLEKCVDKYGAEEGLFKWKARQEKWQRSLSSKSPDEIERINRAKITTSLNRNGYSNISQILFKEIDDRLHNAFSTQYATKGELVNNEKFYIDKNGKCYFFDFYTKESNKIIEFDGDYWHGEKRGNQERDRLRDEILISEGFKILRVKERDYKKDPEKVLQECLNFLKL